MEKKLKRLIQIKNLLEQLEKEKKEIQSFLISNNFESKIIDWYNIFKSTKNKTVLKNDVDINEFIDKFPNYKKSKLKIDKKNLEKESLDLCLDYPEVFMIETDVDIKEAEKNPDTHDFLTINKTEYLTVKKQK